MGTKHGVARYIPTLRMHAAFGNDEEAVQQVKTAVRRSPRQADGAFWRPPVKKENFGKVIDATLLEYPWHNDYQFVHGKKEFRFERAAHPKKVFWERANHSEKEWPNAIEFLLFLNDDGIKESQFISITRHGEMLGQIISALLPASVALRVTAYFEMTTYTRKYFVEPGNIIEKSSYP